MHARMHAVPGASLEVLFEVAAGVGARGGASTRVLPFHVPATTRETQNRGHCGSSAVYGEGCSNSSSGTMSAATGTCCGHRRGGWEHTHGRPKDDHGESPCHLWHSVPPVRDRRLFRR